MTARHDDDACAQDLQPQQVVRRTVLG